MKLTFRIWILILVLFLAFLAISPWKALEKGVVIKSVDKNSTTYDAGLRAGMILTSLNGKAVNDFSSYSSIIQSVFNSEQKRISITADNREFTFLANQLDITVEKIPTSNLRTGLDLSGGARALVKASNASLTSSQLSDLISITSERFNSFGLRDITIKSVKDLQGNNYMLVEIAGATTTDLQDLLGQQGKFEAKIGNQTVFSGGKRDITSVCRTDGQCSGVYDCRQYTSGWSCQFRFEITLSPAAADFYASVTKDIQINGTNPDYLEKTIDFYLDDIFKESLLISKDLKGSKETKHLIQGFGQGTTQNEAITSAKKEMNKLQTILLTGSLPFKLEIVKLDTISPVLGQQFTKNIIFLAVFVFIVISVILFVRYRKIKITGAVILTMFSEAVITLGIAALIRWNLDASSIAGIIAGMGTGVNDQIVIIDESFANKSESLATRIKRAFFIILGAFATIIAAMLPLFWAGAGMLKGFALTTIISVCVGILITRPAFADILKKIQEKV